jgi:hypothetical protein
VDGWWDDVPLSTGPLASRIVSCANPEQKEHDMHTVFVGHDWAEDHHDIHIESSDGGKLHTCRLDDGLDGVRQFHAVLAKLAEDPAEVLIATETDRGLFITAMVAAGYAVIAINPMSTARYRERHSTSGAKSDRADARSWQRSRALMVTTIGSSSPTALWPTRSSTPPGPTRT